MFENDDDLKAAFRRVEPPPGFEQRVLARLDDQRPRPKPAGFGFAAWAGVAAMATLSVGGIDAYMQQRELQRAIDARDQLLLALQITGKTLDSVRDQLDTSGK